MGVSAGSDLIQDGLVYSVDATDKNSYPGSGTAWNDLVHKNNGTLTNGPTFVSAVGGTDYINLDGTNDHIEVGNVAEIKTAINETFSICFWVRPNTGGSGYRCVFGFMNGDNTAGGGIETASGTRRYKFWVGDDSNFAGPECTSDATDNVWCQIVGTSDGSTLRIYFNGVQEDTESRAGCGDITAAGNIRLGCHAGITADGNRYHKGGIGNVQVYNRTLSAVEVTQNFKIQRIRYGV
jgi:hypothetical protein|tara:strand:- start:409 stop:1119 length:711 start_codon:yes stop_codon:yes gene_type:complete